jgi:Membrane bound FAD containing D-sorbitol dehydrogenase
MTTFTRRTVIAGSAASAVMRVGSPAEAAATPDDLATFVDLSAILTGIDANSLAPGVDPFKVKIEYFDLAKNVQPAFSQLLAFYTQNKSADPKDTEQKDVAKKILNHNDPAIRALARSIMLAWLTGSWHNPKNPNEFPRVVSPNAYTQAWIWRVAQAHPMGYSSLQFGYWQDPPLPNFDISHFMIKGNA